MEREPNTDHTRLLMLVLLLHRCVPLFQSGTTNYNNGGFGCGGAKNNNSGSGGDSGDNNKGCGDFGGSGMVAGTSRTLQQSNGNNNKGRGGGSSNKAAAAATRMVDGM